MFNEKRGISRETTTDSKEISHFSSNLEIFFKILLF